MCPTLQNIKLLLFYKFLGNIFCVSSCSAGSGAAVKRSLERSGYKWCSLPTHLFFWNLDFVENTIFKFHSKQYNGESGNTSCCLNSPKQINQICTKSNIYSQFRKVLPFNSNINNEEDCSDPLGVGLHCLQLRRLILAGVSGVQWILVNSGGLSGFTKVPAVRQRCSHLANWRLT